MGSSLAWRLGPAAAVVAVLATCAVAEAEKLKSAVTRRKSKTLKSGAARKVAPPARTNPDVPANSAGGGYFSCGPASRALSGGVYWLSPGSNEPDPELASVSYLSGNATTFDVIGHYAAGYNASAGTLTLAEARNCPGL